MADPGAGYARIMTRSDWLFLAALAAVCLALAVLQYRWTGELSRVEEQRTRAALAAQTQQVAAAVAEELGRSVRQLLPRVDELDALGGRQAHENRYQEWLKQDDGSLFARIGVARPVKGGALELSVFQDGRLAVTEWPAVWKEFRKQAEARLREDGEPPFTPMNANWIEVPVWDDDGEREWLLLDLDMNYVRTEWLPTLVARYLNGDSFVWRAVRADGSVVAGSGRESQPDAEVGIFPTHFPRDRHGETHWQLQVWYRDGSLEAAVRGARWRNLAISGLLLALIMAAGVALLRYNQRARETMAVERRFFASVSHELRTPLTAIRAAGQSLADDVVRGDEQRRQYAGIIVRQAEQLSDLVDQVLHFSAVGAGNGEVALDAVLESARETASGEIRAAGCEVEFRVAASLPKVRGDASALRRLFQNLLTNAARHGGQGKWIGVTAEVDHDAVLVTVRDRGPGMTPSELGQVFTPFFRGEAARSKQTRGVGIGLSLVREIAEAHGGTVTASNDKGAVFTVRLPRAKA
jgi:signal transduction histidine kinase